jgi:hypothetical protein
MPSAAVYPPAMPAVSLWEAAAVAVIVALLYALIRARRARRLANPLNLPYPPGPKPLPIVGNLFDLARENEAATYWKMAQEYGKLLRTFYSYLCLTQPKRRPCIYAGHGESYPHCQLSQCCAGSVREEICQLFR